jgi:hypothetical protein
MRRRTRRGFGALAIAGAAVATVAVAPAGSQTSGRATFDGGLVVSGASGEREVMGSVVAVRGVFTGVGRIVERPNRAGDSQRVSRDDLVFDAGTLHIVNTNRGVSVRPNRRTCRVRVRVRQITTVEGGTGRFAGATGRFRGTVVASAVARRNADGSCDQDGVPLVEVDTVSATGTLSF